MVNENAKKKEKTRNCENNGATLFILHYFVILTD